MRVGLGVSITAHAALLAYGLALLPNASPFRVQEIEALPVELVDIAEATDLKQGDKKAEVAPKEIAQPKPQVKAEIPAPRPAEKPADKPVEAARQPAPRPEPVVEKAPEPEPAPPEPQEVAALPEPTQPTPPPEPEPAPQAEAVPQQPAPTPRSRPKPPKQVAQPKPQPPKPAEAPKPKVAQKAPPQEAPKEFNSDDIAALLNKQDPRGGGDPQPSQAPQTLGAADGHADAAMTQSELAALQARLYQCWNPPVGVREAGALVVTVRINLQQDGQLSTQPQVLDAGFHPLAQVAAESAVRAVVQCAPFGDILRPEKYALWREIDFVFDPRQMLGG